MSNYYVNAVHYDSDRNVIEKLRGINNSKDFDFLRSEVIEKIDSGLIFYTLVKDKNEKFNPGERIDVYTVDGTKWLKTKKNDIKKDNLGNLIEY
jgi:hypothetical protein